MTKTFEPDQTVYLPDGREAIYVLANGQDHLVRVIYEVEGSYDEPPYSYPSDKITTTREVYAKPPVEVWDKQVEAKREQVRELDRELTAKRAEVRAAESNKIAMENAAAKYPCIQQALDFIEGRITHVVSWTGYGGAKIETLKEAFTQEDTWGGRRAFEGMKLLNLFGTNEKGRSTAWGLNAYRDGSGSSQKQIWPAHSEGHAMQIVGDLFFKAVEAWRTGEKNWHTGQVNIDDTLKQNPWLTAPDDWLEHQKGIKAKHRAERIEKLREEIAKMEDEA